MLFSRWHHQAIGAYMVVEEKANSSDSNADKNPLHWAFLHTIWPSPFHASVCSSLLASPSGPVSIIRVYLFIVFFCFGPPTHLASKLFADGTDTPTVALYFALISSCFLLFFLWALILIFEKSTLQCNCVFMSSAAMIIDVIQYLSLLIYLVISSLNCFHLNV